MYNEPSPKPNDPNYKVKMKAQKYTTLAHFERARTISGIVSILLLGFFLFSVYVTVPLFFANWWLIVPFSLLLIYTRSFGSWEAYTKVREQSDVIALELDELDRTNAELGKKFTDVK